MIYTLMEIEQNLFQDIRILTKDLQKVLLRNWGLNSSDGLIYVSLSVKCIGNREGKNVTCRKKGISNRDIERK